MQKRLLNCNCKVEILLNIHSKNIIMTYCYLCKKNINFWKLLLITSIHYFFLQHCQDNIFNVYACPILIYTFLYCWKIPVKALTIYFLPRKGIRQYVAFTALWLFHCRKTRRHCLMSMTHLRGFYRLLMVS